MHNRLFSWCVLASCGSGIFVTGCDEDYERVEERIDTQVICDLLEECNPPAPQHCAKILEFASEILDESCSNAISNFSYCLEGTSCDTAEEKCKDEALEFGISCTNF